jgi:hypothetical protein
MITIKNIGEQKIAVIKCDECGRELNELPMRDGRVVMDRRDWHSLCSRCEIERMKKNARKNEK